MFVALLIAAAAATMSPSPSPSPTPTATPAPTPTPTPAPPAQVAVVWHLAAQPYGDRTVSAAAAALAASDSLAPIVQTLRSQPRAHFALAIDADVLDALGRAARGETALRDAASGRLTGDDPRAADMLRVLSRVPVLTARLGATGAARRYEIFAQSATLALGGDHSVRFSTNDYVSFAGLAALVRLAAAGDSAANAAVLAKRTLTVQESSGFVERLAARAADVFNALRDASRSTQLEMLADPAGEPILPLLVDSGGKSGPNVVPVDAATDASWSIAAAMRSIGAIDQSGSPGVYSPHGAYDDKTAAVMEHDRVAFALFSDRVLRASPIGGSRDAVRAADAAAFHAYALHVTTGPALPALFWSQDLGAQLDVLSRQLPVSAMGAHLASVAREAGARGGAGAILVVRIEADGLWSRRVDSAQVVAAIVSEVDRRGGGLTTIGQYLRLQPPLTAVYGFSPGSDEGALAYWMGSSNQASMWSALATARVAAGGDAALDREATRVPLLDAEASHWYLAPSLLAPTADVQRLLERFRALVAAVYRGAGKRPPENIAPLRSEAPTPGPSPKT